MTEEKLDRRVKYTKNVLKETLIELMAKHHISKISVKKICEIADINRSTFYAHYDNQYDLLNQIERETIQDIHAFIAKETSQQDSLHTMLYLILEYAAQNAELLRILLNERSDSSLRKEIIRMVQEMGLVESRITYKLDQQLIEYILLFSINGCLSILISWIENGMVETVDELADLLFKLTNLGISGYQIRT